MTEKSMEKSTFAKASADNKKYVLSELPYGYDELAPYISEEQLKIHHDKHHQAYVTGANAILDKLDNARKENSELELKGILKELSFNIGGHILHSIFWNNLRKAEEANAPEGKILEEIENNFGSFERFKQEFTKTANSCEGSGWAALCYCKKTKRLMLMQIEKHNVNVYPSFEILLVLDVWEHAYYLDYKNERMKFTDAFWNIVNWDNINEKLEKIVA